MTGGCEFLAPLAGHVIHTGGDGVLRCTSTRGIAALLATPRARERVVLHFHGGLVSDGRAPAAANRFGVRVWVGGASRLLNARTDQVITGIISTEATLGVYAVAVNASELLYYLAGAAAATLLPAVTGGDPSLRLERTLRVYRSVLLLTLIGIVVGAALGPIMLPLVFGHAYRPAVGPFLWLLPSGIGFATMSVFSGAALGSLAPGLSSLGPLAALVTQTAHDLLLISRAGASGAGIGATGALLVGGGVAVCVYRSRFPFAWRLLPPRVRDLGTIGGLARQVPRRPVVAAR